MFVFDIYLCLLLVVFVCFVLRLGVGVLSTSDGAFIYASLLLLLSPSCDKLFEDLNKSDGTSRAPYRTEYRVPRGTIDRIFNRMRACVDHIT